MIEIKHRHDKEFKNVIHGYSVTGGNDYTLCGQDSVGDYEREIISLNSNKKINCPNCIELIWGIHKCYSLGDCDLKEVSKNKRILKLYNINQ